MLTVLFVATAVVVTSKLVDVAPAGTVTLAGVATATERLFVDTTA